MHVIYISYILQFAHWYFGTLAQNFQLIKDHDS